MVCSSVLNDLAKAVSWIPETNALVGTETVPALALPKAETARAMSFGLGLYW